MDLGQVLHLQLPVALRRENTDTMSIAVVGSASERFMHAVRSAIEIDKYKNTIQYKKESAYLAGIVAISKWRAVTEDTECCARCRSLLLLLHCYCLCC